MKWREKCTWGGFDWGLPCVCPRWAGHRKYWAWFFFFFLSVWVISDWSAAEWEATSVEVRWPQRQNNVSCSRGWDRDGGRYFDLCFCGAAVDGPGPAFPRYLIQTQLQLQRKAPTISSCFRQTPVRPAGGRVSTSPHQSVTEQILLQEGTHQLTWTSALM